jgi:hypothetical protein
LATALLRFGFCALLAGVPSATAKLSSSASLLAVDFKALSSLTYVFLSPFYFS